MSFSQQKESENQVTNKILTVPNAISMAACIIYAVVLLFQLVTLPVELNASSRAMTYMRTIGLTSNEQKASKKLLTACAMTYVVAAIASAIQFLWILASSDN